jgi:hypothetical protein
VDSDDERLNIMINGWRGNFTYDIRLPEKLLIPVVFS